jgi:hypothetical protein
MKEFTSAVEDVLLEDEREAKIRSLMDEGKTREEAEAEVGDDGGYIEFKLDDRVLRAYMPHQGQLTFMLAATGRGQSAESRFAAIINIMMESLRAEDQDYFEGRLLTRDPNRRLAVKKIEEIFEYLVEEWFARPTQS